VRRVSRAHGVLFLVNDRVDIALACNADGVHLGQADMPAPAARKMLGRRKIIGLSVHNIEEFEMSRHLDTLDYIGVGPVFKTYTKPDVKPIGLGLIKRILKQKHNHSIFAIGGINLDNLDDLLNVGINKIAVSAAIQEANRPSESIKYFRKKLYDTA
jgi:thiamine-phosphate pyrophosphorylase